MLVPCYEVRISNSIDIIFPKNDMFNVMEHPNTQLSPIEANEENTSLCQYQIETVRP